MRALQPPEQNPAIDTALLSRIEDAGLNASAPPQQLWLDGWLVRFSAGKAKRARCVNAVAAGRTPVAAKLASCAALYAEADLPLIVRITPFTLPPGLDQTLADAGLRRFDDTLVMVLAMASVQVDEVAASLAPDALARLSPAGAMPAASPKGDCTIAPLGHSAFAQRVGGFRDTPLSQRQAHADRLVNSPVPFHGFELRQHGVAVACGQFAIEGDLVGLYDVFTAPDARRHGHASLLCRQLLHEARARGARHAYLQVEADNEAAQAVYRRLGFVDGYAYHYRTRDPAAA